MGSTQKLWNPFLDVYKSLNLCGMSLPRSSTKMSSNSLYCPIEYELSMFTYVNFVQEMNKIEAYKQTKRDPQELVDALKKRFMVSLDI